MNTTRLRLSLCALAALAISSCVHPLEKRIANNLKIYQSLSASDQLLVHQGRIREGMTKEGVFLAMGRADQVAFGVQKGSRIEKWNYLGSQPVYTIVLAWAGVVVWGIEVGAVAISDQAAATAEPGTRSGMAALMSSMFRTRPLASLFAAIA
jgi:hypothetical protein